MDVKDLTLAHVKSHLQVEFRSGRALRSFTLSTVRFFNYSVFFVHLFFFFLCLGGLMYKERSNLDEGTDSDRRCVQ